MEHEKISEARPTRREFIAYAGAASAGLLVAGCGGGGGGSNGSNPKQVVASMVDPSRSVGARSFNDALAFPGLASTLYPEMKTLAAAGTAATPILAAQLADTSVDGTETADNARALVAFAMELGGDPAAIAPLRTYLDRAKDINPVPYISVQVGAHALAVLSGQTNQLVDFYSYDRVKQVIAGAAGRMQTRHALYTNPVTPGATPTLIPEPDGHCHRLAPRPLGWGLPELTPQQIQDRADEVTKGTAWEPFAQGRPATNAFSVFTDPIEIVKPATRSYQCHSWTFRPDDTVLPDLTQRYLLFGGWVPAILSQEGYADVTTNPAQWAVGDAVVFTDKVQPAALSQWVVHHSGRLSQLGTSLDDPNLRYHCKWSETHPEIISSVRDSRRLGNYKYCYVLKRAAIHFRFKSFDTSKATYSQRFQKQTFYTLDATINGTVSVTDYPQDIYFLPGALYATAPFTIRHQGTATVNTNTGNAETIVASVVANVPNGSSDGFFNPGIIQQNFGPVTTGSQPIDLSLQTTLTLAASAYANAPTITLLVSGLASLTPASDLSPGEGDITIIYERV
ncbi:MAG: hypothetical protein JWL77_4539 [Chthonomonadaceae bacterium]|nr:hypothetical protein [Chthonomonadaceae bacterium]